MHHPPAMILAALRWNVSPPTTMLIIGAALVYVASRSAADALAGARGNAGLRAIGHCLPVAIVSLMCLHPSMTRPGTDMIGRPQIAIGLIFSTSVACLSLVLGVSTYMSPLTHFPPARKIWPFIMPAALIALVAGFNGHLTIIHAGIFALLGVAVLNFAVGLEPGESTARETEPVAKPAWSRWSQFVLSALLTLIGGWAMARGASGIEQTSRVLTGVVLAGTVIGPLISMPVLGTCSKLAEQGKTESAVSTLVAMVLINLCAILPLVIAVHYLQGVMNVPDARASLDPTVVAATQPTLAAPFPLVSWRIDSVLLVLLGFAMIPWSLGRWTISRLESIALIIAYAIYLALVAILSVR